VNGPIEPSADVRIGAAALRQTSLALVQEGFTEPQALQIIGQMLAIAAQQGGES
jgi:hypothetical protein